MLQLDNTCKGDLKQYLDNPNELFKRDKFDNLSDVYYLLNIIKSQDIRVNDEFKTIIEDYIVSFQTEEGSYAFSQQHKKSVDLDLNPQNRGEIYLSTYYAVSSYRMLEKELDKKSDEFQKLYKWIDLKIKYLDKFDLNTSGHLLNLLQSALIIGYPVDLNKMKFVAQKIAAELLDYQKQYKNATVLDILNAFELLDTLNVKNERLFTDDSLFEYILSLQNEDGGYSFSTEERVSNLLATFLSIKILSSNNIEIPTEMLSKTLRKFALDKLCVA